MPSAALTGATLHPFGMRPFDCVDLPCDCIKSYDLENNVLTCKGYINYFSGRVDFFLVLSQGYVMCSMDPKLCDRLNLLIAPLAKHSSYPCKL